VNPQPSFFQRFFGPRTPRGELRAHPSRYVAPSVVLALAAVCLFAASFLPVWSMTLKAPQYPKGLTVTAYVDHLEGDVREIDGLNHYIGMRPLNEAAQLERELGIYAIVGLALLCVSAIVVHTKWAALLAAPAFSFPFVFLADLYYWMRDSGLNLDPKAPLSSSIKPFVPPILGEGVIGQFRTVAGVESGYLLALLASALIVVGLYLHRRAYKPLVERALAPEPSHAAP
jgi:copper chaperone NosL